LSVCLLFA